MIVTIAPFLLKILIFIWITVLSVKRPVDISVESELRSCILHAGLYSTVHRTSSPSAGHRRDRDKPKG